MFRLFPAVPRVPSSSLEEKFLGIPLSSWELSLSSLELKFPSVNLMKVNEFICTERSFLELHIFSLRKVPRSNLGFLEGKLLGSLLLIIICLQLIQVQVI